MIKIWKSLSQSYKGILVNNFVYFILLAVFGVLAYFVQRWWEPIKPTDTQVTQIQTTSGDNSPSVYGTKGNVTININNPASDKLPSDNSTIPHFLSQKNRDTDLRIINARLIPHDDFTFREGAGTFNDDIGIYVEVRNFGDKPIHLTSVDVDIVGNGPLKFGPWGGGFDSDPRRNESIILNLGESKELHLSKGIFMDGISEIFCEQFSDVWVTNHREKYKPYRNELYVTNSASDIARLNTVLAEQFGNDAGIKLTFYSNYRKVLTQHILHLSNGTDLFNSKSGLFQHDVFLGSGLVQLFDDLKRAASIRLVSLDGKKTQYLDMEKYVKKYKTCYGKTPQLF
jgi:hypothetical protein